VINNASLWNFFNQRCTPIKWNGHQINHSTTVTLTNVLEKKAHLGAGRNSSQDVRVVLGNQWEEVYNKTLMIHTHYQQSKKNHIFLFHERKKKRHVSFFIILDGNKIVKD